MISFTAEWDMQDVIYEMPDAGAVVTLMEHVEESIRQFRDPKITGGSALCMIFDLICEKCDWDKTEMLGVMNKVIPEVNQAMGNMLMEERGMNQEWKVLSNPVNGKYFYQVYRIKNANEPMHSGNIETTGRLYDSEEEAEAAAKKLNEEGA